jgi:hypothetical protein
MVVDVGFLAVLAFLFAAVVVMAVANGEVVVFVGVPVGAMLELADHAAMVMGDVVVVVRVHDLGMFVGRLRARVFDALNGCVSHVLLQGTRGPGVSPQLCRTLVADASRAAGEG